MRRLALTCALAAVPVVLPSAAVAAPCGTATKTISGTVQGQDGRYVNAQLGFDLMQVTSSGVRHLDGRAGSDRYGCAGYKGYGQVVFVNSQLPATGSTTSGTKTWRAVVPAIVNQVIVEVYPRSANRGPVDDRRYSGALRWRVPIPYGKPINITLPLVCAAGGKTGYLAGTATKGGQPLNVDFVGAWSMAKDNNTAQPILGFRVGYGTDRGTWAIRNLASGQQYTIVWIENGVRRQKYGYAVNACKGTAASVAF